MLKSYLKYVAVLALLFICIQDTKAQDVHLSQYYASPMLLNPAMTGNLNGCYRFAANYKNQWASIPAPYNTVAASFDMPILRSQLGIDHAGVGLAFYNDQSGDGVLNDMMLMGSLAYHKAFDRNKRFVLSVGAQGSYNRKSIDITKLYFESQLSGSEFDPALPNNEAFQDNKFGFMDLQVGGLLAGKITRSVNLYGGLSYYHIAKPNESFLGENNVRSNRMVVHGGGEIMVSNDFSVNPNVLYMAQSTTNELTTGAAFGYHFDQGSGGGYGKTSNYDGSAFYLGAWYRWDDAVIVVAAVDYNSFKFGFSYDINTSKLQNASLNQGGIELSLMYIGCMAEGKNYPPAYCPRF